jgi:hypothetical protein
VAKIVSYIASGFAKSQLAIDYFSLRTQRHAGRNSFSTQPCLLFVSLPVMTPEANAYGYTYFRVLSELYLLDGVK